MQTITLKNTYQVEQLLQSIATNIIEIKKINDESETNIKIAKQLIDLATSIENQTGILTFQSVAMSTLFADILAKENLTCTTF